MIPTPVGSLRTGMKPISASEAIRGRQLLPSSNRFEILRDSSNSNIRERSSSAKRKASEDAEQLQSQAPKRPNQGKNSYDDILTVSRLEMQINLLYGITATFNEEVAKLSVDPGLETVLRCMCKFMDTATGLQAELVSSIAARSQVKGDTLGRAPWAPKQKVRKDTCTDLSDSDMETSSATEFRSYSQVASKPKLQVPLIRKTKPPTSDSLVDPKVKAFQDAVKSAERSTLIFNLNMGTTKILNEKSILAKATLALT